MTATCDRDAILDFVLRYFPRQFEFVTSQLDAFSRLDPPGVAGSLLMIWAAMGVFSAITSAINHAWGVEKQPSYFKHKLMAFIMLVAASLLLLGGLLLVSAINIVEARWFAVIVLVRPRDFQCSQRWAVKSASTVIFIFLVGLIFYFVPNATVRFRDVWVGAVLTGLLWPGALFGFSWYMRDLSRFIMSTARLRRSWCSWCGSTPAPSCCCSRGQSRGLPTPAFAAIAGGAPCCADPAPLARSFSFRWFRSCRWPMK